MKASQPSVPKRNAFGQGAPQQCAQPPSALRRHGVGRADLARLLGSGADAETAAALTGFVPPEPKEQHIELPQLSTGQVFAPSVVTTEPSAVPSTPLWRAIGPRVHPIDENIEPGEPAWLRAATPFNEAELAAQPGFTPPRPRPLLRRARLVPLLRRLLAVPALGAVDEPRLVHELAKGLALRRVPRRARFSWPQRVQLYWDQSVPLQSCWHDQHDVAEWLRRWCGTLGLEEVIVDSAGRALCYPSPRRHRKAPHRSARPNQSSRPRQLRDPKPPRPPDAGTVLLALSDLGAMQPDSSRARFWQALAQRATRAGTPSRVLLLAPAERLGAQLVRLYTGAEWETARPLTRRSASNSSSGSNSAPHRDAARDQLLCLLSRSVRIEPGLLRAARRLLPRSQADLGTELDAWMDARVNGRSSFGMMLDPSAIQPLRERLANFPARLQQRIDQLLEHHHHGLSPLVLSQEQLRSNDPSTHQRGLATLRRYAKWWTTQSPHTNLAAHAFVERWSARNREPDWSAPETAAVWALAHRLPGGKGFTTEPPSGLRLADIAWTLEPAPHDQLCRIWQHSAGLSLLPAASSDEPLPGTPGSLLAVLPFRTPPVKVAWRHWLEAPAFTPRALDLSRPRQLSLPSPFTIPPGAQIHLETDRASLTLVLQPRPDWADALIRDRHQLNVELDEAVYPRSVRLFEVARADLSEPTPEVDAPLTFSWPPWANEVGRDKYGLYADLTLNDQVTMRLRWIPPGRFLMGSPEDEAGRYNDDGPQHEVTLTYGFWLAETPCTQDQWHAVMNTEPSYFRGPSRPVEEVSWEDCQDFCQRLSVSINGLSARLPTEAEWEYACRAGTQSAFNDGSPCTEPMGADPALAKLGWFESNSGGETHPVRQLAANQWGLYDMHGNVLEWCLDGFGEYGDSPQVDPSGAASGHERVIRGGSWVFSAGYCRSAFRSHWHPSGRLQNLGFRLAAGQLVSKGAGSEAEPATWPMEPGGVRGAEPADAAKGPVAQRNSRRERARRSPPRPATGSRRLFQRRRQ